MLDFVDKALDQGAFPITIRIVLARLLAIFTRRNHRNRIMFKNKSDQIIAIIGAISQDIVTQLVAQERLALGTIMAFTAGQREAQGIAQRIRFYMDFGAESTATAPQGLGILSTVFLGAPAAHG